MSTGDCRRRGVAQQRRPASARRSAARAAGRARSSTVGARSISDTSPRPRGRPGCRGRRRSAARGRWSLKRCSRGRTAVLVELLAVVGGDDDQRVVEQAALLERVEQSAQLGVDRRHLARRRAPPGGPCRPAGSGWRAGDSISAHLLSRAASSAPDLGAAKRAAATARRLVAARAAPCTAGRGAAARRGAGGLASIHSRARRRGSARRAPSSRCPASRRSRASVAKPCA